MERDDRIKWNVAQGKSTYLNDYRWSTEYEKRPRSDFPNATEEPPEKPSKEPVPLDMETFIPWRKGVNVPFNLYHQPKEIIGMYPKSITKMPDPIVDNEKENVIKSRPRVYMKSAVSLDDVPDPEMRKLLIEAIYVTDGRLSEKEATGSFQPKPPPPEIRVGESHSFAVELDLFPHIKNGRDKIAGWDGKQSRAVTNANKMFWTHTKLPTRDGSPLPDLVEQSKKEEIRKLIEEERLRLPHDYPKPLYAGYKPRLSYGIPLRKNVEAVTHPFISTAQAITKRYEKD